MIGYKVVTTDLRSIALHYYRIQYKIGEFVKPNIKNSVLFYFKDLESASKYAFKMGGNIYKCEVIGSGNILPVCLNQISYFWRLKKNKKSTSKIERIYWDGCKSAKQIKLLEKV